MKVAGIDLSLTGTGLAIHEAGGLTFALEFGEDGKLGAPLDSRADRIDRLVDWVLEHTRGVDLAVFEAHDFGAKHSASTHDRSGAWWILHRELRRAGTRVAQVPPSTLKMYLTGNGTSSKDAMLATAVRQYPTVQVMSNNQADALAACSMGVRHLELIPLEGVWNQKMAQAMSKAEWPV